MNPIIYKVTTFPPEDDPGWYEADVWDCGCGVGKIAQDCLDCPGCLEAQPPGSVYRGRCWGMKLPENASSLLDVKMRPFPPTPRGESLADIRGIDDAEFFKALHEHHSKGE